MHKNMTNKYEQKQETIYISTSALHLRRYSPDHPSFLTRRLGAFPGVAHLRPLRCPLLEVRSNEHCSASEGITRMPIMLLLQLL